MNAASKTGNVELLAKAMRWYQLISKNDFPTFESLKRSFPSVDQVKDRLKFNLGSYLLISGVDFRRQIIFIQAVLTHAEYDKAKW